MLKQRLITAVILIAIALCVLFFLPPSAFCIVMAMLSLAAGWEWTSLMGLQWRMARVLYVVILLAVMANALIFAPIMMVMLLAFCWWIFAFILITLYPRRGRWLISGIYLRGLMGILVIVPCWMALSYLRNLPVGIPAMLFLFALIWGADTVAYFAGRRFGTMKLAPAVSPGKSVQGAFASVLYATLLTFLVLCASTTPKSVWWFAIMVSILTVLFSIVGDLFESMLKRQVGLKDSGRLLPGHGGLLDRIDSLTAAAPVFALGLFLISAIFVP